VFSNWVNFFKDTDTLSINCDLDFDYGSGEFDYISASDSHGDILDLGEKANLIADFIRNKCVRAITLSPMRTLHCSSTVA